MKKSLLRFKPLLLLLLFILFSCSSDDENEKLSPFSTDPCELITPTPDSLRFKAIYDKPMIMLPENHIFYSKPEFDLRISRKGPPDWLF